MEWRNLWLRIFVLALLTVGQTGCSLLLIASAGTTAATGKSIGDHAASSITQHDCNGIELAKGRQDYYCERTREPGETYNRTSF